MKDIRGDIISLVFDPQPVLRLAGLMCLAKTNLEEERQWLQPFFNDSGRITSQMGCFVSYSTHRDNLLKSTIY